MSSLFQDLTGLMKECLGKKHKETMRAYEDDIVFMNETPELLDCRMKGSCGFTFKPKGENSVAMTFKLTAMGAAHAGIFLPPSEKDGQSRKHFMYALVNDEIVVNYRVFVRYVDSNCIQIDAIAKNLYRMQELFELMLSIMVEFPDMRRVEDSEAHKPAGPV